MMAAVNVHSARERHLGERAEFIAVFREVLTDALAPILGRDDALLAVTVAERTLTPDEVVDRGRRWRTWADTGGRTRDAFGLGTRIIDETERLLYGRDSCEFSSRTHDVPGDAVPWIRRVRRLIVEAGY